MPRAEICASASRTGVGGDTSLATKSLVPILLHPFALPHGAPLVVAVVVDTTENRILRAAVFAAVSHLERAKLTVGAFVYQT